MDASQSAAGTSPPPRVGGQKRRTREEDDDEERNVDKEIRRDHEQEVEEEDDEDRVIRLMRSGKAGSARWGPKDNRYGFVAYEGTPEYNVWQLAAGDPRTLDPSRDHGDDTLRMSAATAAAASSSSSSSSAPAIVPPWELPCFTVWNLSPSKESPEGVCEESLQVCLTLWLDDEYRHRPQKPLPPLTCAEDVLRVAMQLGSDLGGLLATLERYPHVAPFLLNRRLPMGFAFASDGRNLGFQWVTVTPAMVARCCTQDLVTRFNRSFGNDVLDTEPVKVDARDYQCLLDGGLAVAHEALRLLHRARFKRGDALYNATRPGKAPATNNAPASAPSRRRREALRWVLYPTCVAATTSFVYMSEDGWAWRFLDYVSRLYRGEALPT